MANVKIYTRLPQIFPLTLTVSKIYTFKICDLQKVGRGHEMQFAQLHHSKGNVEIFQTFLGRLLPFQRYKKSLPPKSKSRSRSQFSQIHRSMASVKIGIT